MNNPEHILKAWMAAVNEGKVEDILALYAPNSILIPTFSNRLLRTPEQRSEYFHKLSTREDLSVALHDKTLSSQTVSDDVYALSGIYCWRFAIDEQLLSFEARFSYMLNLALPHPIIHHHSSQIPRML